MSAAQSQRRAQTADKAPTAASHAHVPRRVLVIEDNMIIAIDTEEKLLALGVGVGEVILASSNATALAAIDGNLPDFALLDFNLGGETTGYGKVEGMTAHYRHSVGVLQKPYAKEELARILAQPIPASSDRRQPAV